MLILVTEAHNQLVEKDDQIDVDQSLVKLQIIKWTNDDIRDITFHQIICALC